MTGFLEAVWTRDTTVDTRQADGTWVTKTLPLSTVEFRPDRPYDEQRPGHLVMPDGSLVGSSCRTFLGGAGRLVPDLYDRERLAVAS